MKITSVYVERSFKIKDYKMRKIGFTAELSDQDKPLEVTRDLEMLIHQHHENMIAAGNGVAGLPSQTSMHVSPPAKPTPPNNHILSELPKELSDQLTATKQGNEWKISVNSYLKPQDFTRVKEYLTPRGGSYHMATANEHGYWTAPLKEGQA